MQPFKYTCTTSVLSLAVIQVSHGLINIFLLLISMSHLSNTLLSLFFISNVMRVMFRNHLWLILKSHWWYNLVRSLLYSYSRFRFGCWHTIGGIITLLQKFFILRPMLLKLRNGWLLKPWDIGILWRAGRSSWFCLVVWLILLWFFLDFPFLSHCTFPHNQLIDLCLSNINLILPSLHKCIACL